MSEPTIAQKSPIPVEVEAGKDYWWCACGQSKNQPFCDGSHKGSGFTPMKWTAEAIGPQVLLRLQAHQEPAVLRRQPQGALSNPAQGVTSRVRGLLIARAPARSARCPNF